MIHLIRSCKIPFAHHPYPALLVELRRGAGGAFMQDICYRAYIRVHPGEYATKNKNIFKKLLKMLDNVIYIWYNITRKKRKG